jgi:hypothetical protein
MTKMRFGFPVVLLALAAANVAGAQVVAYSSGGEMSYDDSGHGTFFTVNGDAELSADGRDVVRMSEEAVLVFTELMPDGSTRQIEFRDGPSREVLRTFRVNGTRRPIAEAAGWLAEFLPAALAEAGIGFDGVLAEAARDTSSFDQSQMFVTALVDTTVSAADFARGLRMAEGRLTKPRAYAYLLERLVGAGSPWFPDSKRMVALEAAGRLPSGEEKAGVLRAAARAHDALLSDSARAAFFGAVGTLELDSERADVLGEALRADGRLPEEQAGVVLGAQRLASPAARAAVLMAVPADALRDPSVRAAYAATLGTLSRGPDRRRAEARLAGSAPAA